VGDQSVGRHLQWDESPHLRGVRERAEEGGRGPVNARRMLCDGEMYQHEIMVTSHFSSSCACSHSCG